MKMKQIKTLATTLLRLIVLLVTVTLLIQMFDKGGWWIVACLAWLPVNWIVVAIYGDDQRAAKNPGPGPLLGR